MQQIIQGNDTTVSVILYQQSIHLSGTADETQVESTKINLRQVKEISVRLIPYMRWEEVSPRFSVRDNVLEVAFPATQQRQGKWDIEISFLMPSDGGYKQARVKQAFAEVLPTNYPTSTLSAYVVSAEVTSAMRGAPGLDAYESALARGLVTSVESWIKLIKGPQGDPGTDGDPGKDAYTIYLETTKDNPPLSREKWANLNDFLLQLLFRLIKGREAQLTENDMTADLILELDRQRREMAIALRSYGVDVKDTDGIETFAQIIRRGIVDPIKLYRSGQFEDCKNKILPPLKVWDLWPSPSLSGMFSRSKVLQVFPRIDGIAQTVSIRELCYQASEMRGQVALPDLPLCTSAESAFYGCSKLEQLSVGNLAECSSLYNLARDCGQMRTAIVGNAPNCTNVQNLFANCFNLEEVTIGDLGAPTGGWLFFKCERLVRINGVVNLTNTTESVHTIFDNCKALQEVRIKGLKTDLMIHWSTALSLDSVRYLVANAQTVEGKTMTLAQQLFDEHRAEMEAIGRQATAKGFTITYR